MSPHTHVLFSTKCSMRHFFFENALLSKFCLNQNFEMLCHLISMLAHSSDKVDFLQSSTTLLRKCPCTYLNPRHAFQAKKTMVILFYPPPPSTKTMLNYSLIIVVGWGGKRVNLIKSFVSVKNDFGKGKILNPFFVQVGAMP